VREFPIPEGHDWENRAIQSLELSHNTTVVSIVRKGKAVIPKGNTVIRKGDLVTLCEKRV
jgi:voltage-gated potassium channel